MVEIGDNVPFAVMGQCTGTAFAIDAAHTIPGCIALFLVSRWLSLTLSNTSCVLRTVSALPRWMISGGLYVGLKLKVMMTRFMSSSAASGSLSARERVLFPTESLALAHYCAPCASAAQRIPAAPSPKL
jgi:hypothetical protein